MTAENKTMKDIELEQKKKVRIGLYIAIGVCVLYIIIGSLIALGEVEVLPLIMGVIIFAFGPITAVFYLIDVKKGVFKPTAEEEKEYELMMEESLKNK